jgi:glycosyltransferase involved in cell wall biosynthesis
VLNGISSFAKIRNKAAKKAHGEWLFYIDADERATPELKKEILTKINSKNPTSYDIPRKNYIFGKWFRHGGQWPDRVLRLIKKEAFIKYVGDLHEQPKIKGEMGSLENYMIHRKDMTLSQMVEKTNLWSEVEARLMFEADHPPMNIPRFVSAMLREFWHQFVKQAIFLDGPKGIIYGLYQVYSRFISYAKLWEMQIAS